MCANLFVPRMRLDQSGRSELLIGSHIVNPVSLSYDWIHDALYWADVTPSHSEFPDDFPGGDGGPTGPRARIEVVALDGVEGRNKGGRGVLRATVLEAPHVQEPRYLVVDPRRNQG